MEYEEYPLIKSVSFLQGHNLLIVFDNGETRIVDMSESFEVPAALKYAPLSVFKKFSFTKWYIAWGDEDYTVGHDSLYNMSLSPSQFFLLILDELTGKLDLGIQASNLYRLWTSRLYLEMFDYVVCGLDSLSNDFIKVVLPESNRFRKSDSVIDALLVEFTDGCSKLRSLIREIEQIITIDYALDAFLIPKGLTEFEVSIKALYKLKLKLLPLRQDAITVQSIFNRLNATFAKTVIEEDVLDNSLLPSALSDVREAVLHSIYSPNSILSWDSVKHFINIDTADGQEALKLISEIRESCWDVLATMNILLDKMGADRTKPAYKHLPENETELSQPEAACG